MCQIQFIKRKGCNLTQRDIAEFFKLMELGSIDNNCAFGFFNDKILHKDKGAFNLATFQEEHKLLTGTFIAGHNRLATTGKKEKAINNHPFTLNSFVLVHNGTIDNNEALRTLYNIRTPVDTDSYVILWLIDHYFQKSDTKDRKQRITAAIQKTAKQLDGSFSVLLHDRVSDGLYYFKNSLTSFSFYLFGEDILVGSTNPVNLKHVYLNDRYLPDTDLFKERTVKKVESNRVYLIDNDLRVKELGSFESSEDSVQGYPYSHYEWEYIDAGDYLKMTTRQRVELVFKSFLTYVPDFSFSESTGIVKVRYDKAILNDLQYFIEGMYCEDGYIFLSLAELLANMEGLF